jgi:hypothetical protein
MSSDRSTFVRRWPSTPGLLACTIAISYDLRQMGSGKMEGRWEWERMGKIVDRERRKEEGRHTVFPAPNFFSVPIIAPLL